MTDHLIVALVAIISGGFAIPVGWVSVGLWRRQTTKGQLPDPFAVPSVKGDDPR
jgi:hypothetical protein